MRNTLFTCLLLTLLLAGCNKPADTVIKTPVPARPAGQTDVLGLTVDPVEFVAGDVAQAGDFGAATSPDAMA